MFRLLLIGSLLLGLGMGLRNGWIEVKWSKITQDLNVPFLSDPEPLRSFTEASPKDAKAKQAR